MIRTLIKILIFIKVFSSCSNDNDPCPCEFIFSPIGLQNNSYYGETIVSMPNPYDSYLGQNIYGISTL